jgi:hypothetical protein
MGAEAQTESVQLSCAPEGPVEEQLGWDESMGKTVLEPLRSQGEKVNSFIPACPGRSFEPGRPRLRP